MRHEKEMGIVKCRQKDRQIKNKQKQLERQKGNEERLKDSNVRTNEQWNGKKYK